MGKLSRVLRSVETVSGSGIGFWCPGCSKMHVVSVSGPHAWSWDGNVMAPTLSPSILVTGIERITDDEHARIMAGEKIKPRPLRCHSFLRGGVIDYLGDCSHALAGQKVPLPDLPDERP